MATLARDLQNRGIRLVDPYKAHQQKLALLTREKTEESSASEEEYLSEEEEESDVEEETIMPRTTKKVQPPKSPSDGLNKGLGSLSIGNDNIQPIVGNLQVPYVSGRWEFYDKNSKSMKGFAMLRMNLHPGADADDVQISWQDEYTVVLKIKWPMWMQDSTMMSGLDISQDANGKLFETYPEDHKVYDSFGQTTMHLEAEDGNIYYQRNSFKFKKKMDVTMYKPEVFETQIDQHGRVATILQVLFQELVENKPFMSPTTTKRAGGAIKYSKSTGVAAAATAARKRPSPNARAGGNTTRSGAKPSPAKKKKTN